MEPLVSAPVSASVIAAADIAHPYINRRAGEYRAKSSWNCCQAEGALIAKGRQGSGGNSAWGRHAQMRKLLQRYAAKIPTHPEK
jgi:hypothetical protein